MTEDEYLAQPACAICGARPGWDPTTGVLINHTNHRWGCPYYSEAIKDADA